MPFNNHRSNSYPSKWLYAKCKARLSREPPRKTSPFKRATLVNAAGRCLRKSMQKVNDEIPIAEFIQSPRERERELSTRATIAKKPGPTLTRFPDQSRAPLTSIRLYTCARISLSNNVGDSISSQCTEKRGSGYFALLNMVASPRTSRISRVYACVRGHPLCLT